MTTISKQSRRLQRQGRVRAKVRGTAARPRLSVFRSLKNVRAQVIDDMTSKTLASASLVEAKAKNTVAGAAKVGELIADKCLKLKIAELVFDRGSYRYHGKVKSLAEGVRKGGIKV
ncbi:50S ribosomal protein L18 [Patescibacteria group bacterium]|nr:MAG: 50S ribosomal protein L18 [Patescibacteria group bacterium]